MRPAHLDRRLILCVAIGGLFGAPARYGIAVALPKTTNGFPTATFLTNLVGAFALGALLALLARGGEDIGTRRTLRVLLGTGFLGAFTTYSTLAVDTDLLVRAHRPLLAVVYAVGTVVVGFGCSVAGMAVATGRRRREPS